jgi:hypothetical protein
MQRREARILFFSTNETRIWDLQILKVGTFKLMCLCTLSTGTQCQPQSSPSNNTQLRDKLKTHKAFKDPSTLLPPILQLKPTTLVKIHFYNLRISVSLQSRSLKARTTTTCKTAKNICPREKVSAIIKTPKPQSTPMQISNLTPRNKFLPAQSALTKKAIQSTT